MRPVRDVPNRTFCVRITDGIDLGGTNIKGFCKEVTMNEQSIDFYVKYEQGMNRLNSSVVSDKMVRIVNLNKENIADYGVNG